MAVAMTDAEKAGLVSIRQYPLLVLTCCCWSSSRDEYYIQSVIRAPHFSDDWHAHGKSGLDRQ